MLDQILYHYQLITHFNPHTIRAATVLLLVLIRPNTLILLPLMLLLAILVQARVPITALIVLEVCV